MREMTEERLKPVTPVPQLKDQNGTFNTSQFGDIWIQKTWRTDKHGGHTVTATVNEIRINMSYNGQPGLKVIISRSSRPPAFRKGS